MRENKSNLVFLRERKSGNLGFDKFGFLFRFRDTIFEFKRYEVYNARNIISYAHNTKVCEDLCS